MDVIEKLVNDIEKFNKSYRLGTPEISDSEYDKLVDELRLLDPCNPWFSKTEPSPVKSGRKKKLPIPMKSLNKAKSLQEIKQWAHNLGLPPKTLLVITPKYDGVSWLHSEIDHTTYSRGGSENEGQDCSAHFIEGGFNEIKDRSKFPAAYTFGELVFSCKSWEDKMAGKISDSTGEPYRSPRNTVAGFINRDVPHADIANAEFVRYGVDEDSLHNWHSYANLMADIDKEFGDDRAFRKADVAPYKVMPLECLDEDCLNFIYRIFRTRYYIDGLVIYINDLHLWETIGRHQTSGNPLYAIAYKHPDFTETFETTVKGITWNVSKSGALKPVVQIESVDTGDCIMENPTGYNARWCNVNKIGKDAKILVTRSGGVIPKILETLKPGEFELPSCCPACGSQVQMDVKQIELYCTNDNCEGKRLAEIEHFFTTVGAENMGEETIAKIFNAGHRSIHAFLSLTWQKLSPIEGFGEAITNPILSEMQKIKKGIDLATYMQASNCFKGIGKIKAQKFLDSLDDEGLCSFCQGWYYTDWQMTHWPIHSSFKLLPVTAQNIFLGYRSFWKFVDMLGVPFIVNERTQPIGDKYAGLSICFSGIRDKELEEEIIKQGGKIVSGVSKNTTHLVVKDLNATSSKITKAQSLGVKIVTIDKFISS